MPCELGVLLVGDGGSMAEPLADGVEDGMVEGEASLPWVLLVVRNIVPGHGPATTRLRSTCEVVPSFAKAGVRSELKERIRHLGMVRGCPGPHFLGTG